MNTKYLVLVSAMAIMLIGATALATEDAFATEKKHYGKSQTASQVNDCGNDILPENVGCQNTDRQLQGDNNSCTSNLSRANQVFPDENNKGEIQALQTPGEPEIPGESEGGIIRNPFGPGDPFAPLPPC
jgi:hypothetical protein